MPRSLWVKFFVLLLAVSAIALSASLYLRGMMLSDFEQFLEGEALDRVYWVTAGLEGAYERGSGWDKEHMREDVVWALLMGMVVRVRDNSGLELMNTAGAVEGLTPLMRRRVLSLVDMNERTPAGEFVPYPLFLAGERIGTLEVRFFPRDRSRLFIERSNRFLVIAFLVMGGLAVAASLLVSRRLTSPLQRLEAHTRSIRTGDYSGRVPVSTGDEIGRLTRSFNEMADELETLESLRRKVIANVAHELRTPIAAMRGELEGMLDGVIPTDQDELRSLMEEIARLTRILDGIDDLTQAQASSLDLAPRNLLLAPFLAAILEKAGTAPDAEGVATRLEVADDVEAWADPDRLGQVVLNLLANAFRATAPGGTVTVRAGPEGDGTFLEISDTGRGIEKEELPHIFERFYRGGGGGLGLGLAIVRELVDAHGGTIKASSEPGEGAVFRVSLPGRRD